MDPSEPPPDDAVERSGRPDPAGGRRSTARRRLDRRTIAICVCVALIAAIAAGLVVSAAIGGSDGGTGGDDRDSAMTLIDLAEVRTTPLQTVDGERTDLGEHLGDRPVLVNLWASNCAPCIKELPLLQEAAEANADIELLGIDVLDRLDKARAMADKAGIAYPWLQDRNGDFANAVRTTTLPSTLLFAPDGTILASKTDKAFESQAELQGWIDAAT